VLRRIFVRQRGSRNVACWRANKGKGSTGGAPEYSTHCSPPGRSSAVRAGSQATRSESVGGIALSAEVEHCALGSLLFCFRFTLSTTIILVPQALAIRGFEAEQIGPAIIWSAVPLIPLAFIAALLLLRKFDPRLLLAIGLACTALAAWLNSQTPARGRPRTSTAPSCSPASGRRLLSSDLSAASCCKRSSQGFGQT